MKSSPETIILPVIRNRFMKVAPVLLWFFAVFIPIMVGRSIYLETFNLEQEQITEIGRQQLMTKAREIEARLVPELIIKKQLHLDTYEQAYGQITHLNNPKILAELPIAKALPAFKTNISEELAAFSSFLSKHHGISPIFVAGLHESPDRCGLFLDKDLPLPENTNKKYMHEFSKICRFLNERSNYGENEPRELRKLEQFAFFSEYLGIFKHFNTHFWYLYSSFSVNYRERLYIVSMRPPFQKGHGNHIIVGILTSNLEPKIALKNACNELSDQEIKISFGRSDAISLPVFLETTEELSMLIKLPEAFKAAFRPDLPGSAGNTVIKLSLATGPARRKSAAHSSLLNLALMVFLSLSLLFGAGVSLGQLKMRTNLSRLITAVFFVSMFLPLAGLAWLGAANSRTSRETESENIIKLVKQSLRQSETAFILQKSRQQLLMFYISKIIGNMSPNKWESYVDRFFVNDGNSAFKAHFNNFYLYSADLNREFFRGQKPSEKFRKNELPTVFSGAFRRVLLYSDAFSHLSSLGRQKMSQVADFAGGVMEELVDNHFFCKLFGNPVEQNDTTLLARRDLLSVFFLRGPQKMVGMLCLISNDMLLTSFIDELNSQGSFKNKFTILNHRVEIDFFSVSEFHERRLKERKSQYFEKNPPIMNLETADALYANSDASIISNLHLAKPHLLITETMLDRSIFAVARVTPLAKPASDIFGPAILALIALTSCMALAKGISKLILLPVPPFLAALKAIKSDRYDWVLHLQTGDEFDQLGASINDMKISLLERRKMLQLVSKTAAEAISSGEDTQNAPKKKLATVLVSDIRGFTSISESHGAEEVVAMLNSYFTLMCPVIEEHGGYIDKLIGDAIQAVFLAEDERERVLGAARAALEIRRRLADFNAERAARGLFTINNGIGIASGSVTTGLTGSRTGKLEATVLGEPLQNAAILESYSKFAINTCIIIDENSLNAIKADARVQSFLISLSETPNKVSIIELQEV